MKLRVLFLTCTLSILACKSPKYSSVVNEQEIKTTFMEVVVSDEYYQLADYSVLMNHPFSGAWISVDSNGIVHHNHGVNVTIDFSLLLNHDSLESNQTLVLDEIQIVKKSKLADFESRAMNTDTVYIIPKFKIGYGNERVTTLKGQSTFRLFGSSRLCKTIIIFQNRESVLMTRWHKS